MARRKRPTNNISDKSQLDGIMNPTIEDRPERMPIEEPNLDAMPLPPKKAIGVDEIRKADSILQKYRSAKARAEQKIVRNEDFWKLRQRNYEDRDLDPDKPASAWLWSCIQSRYSDAMDSYPTCNFLPRQEDDKMEATKLSAIVPIIMKQNRYEDTYSDYVWYLLKNGTCVQGVFWDADAHNGLGDISIKMVDILNIFWEPSITNIQDSTHVFHTELVDNEELEQRYPQTVGHLGGDKVTTTKYRMDENIDTTNKSLVVDWYYHKFIDGKKTLQYVKYVKDVVLYATENETERPTEPGIMGPVEVGPSMAERGLYDHAMYPFVFTSLYPMEGTLIGMGLTDIGKDTQLIIDKMNKAISMNAVNGAAPRYLSREGGGINEEEFANPNKRIVHVVGNVNDDNIKPIQHAPLDSIYVNFMMQKVDELKYVTSNMDVNNGASPSGVTSASGIAALQEAGGKNARSTNRTIYRSYIDVVYQVVELIRQFYDMPRMFRIIPDGMNPQFTAYDNSGLKPQPQMVAGQNMGYRKPEFDIEVTAEKANPYKKMEINDLALQFYNAGFFNPQMTTQAMACLNMMDFQKKEDVMKEIAKNGTLEEMLVMYQQMALELANQISPELGEQVANQIMNQAGAMAQPTQYDPSIQSGAESSEHPFVAKARQHARSSTEAE